MAYLDEAVARIVLECHPSINLTDRNDITETFNVELNKNEVFLISSLMYQSHLERDISYLKALNVNYTSSDLKVFDPSNARSTYMEMYEFVCQQNDALMDKYKSLDRITGAYKTIDFSVYDDE